ncbi:MAG: glycosyltransferase [Gammaproteobacteria bacterium]|nr:MAG: glycosyltransferase [Gammaproteobacteria bacterium]
MKILCLCKRRPQGRDLLTRPYGRFYHIPLFLSQEGHNVSIILTSYKNDTRERIKKDGITWYSENLSPQICNFNPIRYWNRLNNIVKEEKPDWIIGFSDIWYGILAQKLSEKHNCKYMIDAYDNYESYIPWAKPIHLLWRRALKYADLVTAAGPGLADLLGKNRSKPAEIIPMTADPCFFPRDKQKCRTDLGLPLDKHIIGYSGSIYQSRGIEDLFSIYQIIKERLPNTILVLSGRKDKNINTPDGSIYLGYIEDDKMPKLINCYDVLAVVNQPSSFGDYSYPSKLYEAIASDVPIIASDTPSIKWILQKDSYTVDFTDTNSAALKIENAILSNNHPKYAQKISWKQSAKALSKLLNRS